MWSFSSDSTSSLVHVSIFVNGDVHCKGFYPLHGFFLDICMRFGDSYTPYFLKDCIIMRVILAEGSPYTLLFLTDMYLDLS